MKVQPPTGELVFVISSMPDRQEWVLVTGPDEVRFPDRGRGKVPGLVDAIRHCYQSCDGRPSLLLIQHGGQQFRLRFNAEAPSDLGEVSHLLRTQQPEGSGGHSLSPGPADSRLPSPACSCVATC